VILLFQSLKNQETNIKPSDSLLVFVCLAILIIVSYWSSLGVPWHFDDKSNILDNPAVQITGLSAQELAGAITKGPRAGVLRQSSYLGLALNFYFARILTGDGFNLATWHWVNIIFHILTSYLVFILSLDILKRTREKWDERWRYWISFATAIIFALNPIQTQTVTYIIQRMAGAAAFWYLLSLYLYIKHRSSERKPIPFLGNVPLLIWIFFIWYALYYVWRNVFSSPEGTIGIVISFLCAIIPSLIILFILNGKKLFGRRDGDVHLLLALITGAIAMTTKENAITLPFFYWFYDYILISGKEKNFRLRSIIGWALVILFFALVSPILWEKILDTYKERDFTLRERVLTQFRIVWSYLFLMLWPSPSRLNLDIDVIKSTSMIKPISTLIAFLFWHGAIIGSLKNFKRDKLIPFLILWYFGQLLVESTFIGLEMAYEHRFYLPGWAPILLLTIGIFALVDYVSKKVVLVSPNVFRTITIAFLIAIFSFVSIYWVWQRNAVWSDEIALWQDVVKKSPNKVRPHVNLGFLLEREGLGIINSLEDVPSKIERDRLIAQGTKYVSEAEKEYYKALELDSKNSYARINLGHLYLQRGEYLRALDQFEIANTIKSDDPILQFNLGVTYKEMGDKTKAREHYEKALELKPDYYEVLNNLGILEIEDGNIDKAIQIFEKAIRITRDASLAYYNLGNAYIKAGRYAEAEQSFRNALKYNPGHIKSMVNLANTLALKKDYEGAVKAFIHVLDVNPDHINTHYNLGLIYMNNLNKPKDALYHFKRVLEINPDISRRAEIESLIRKLEGETP